SHTDFMHELVDDKTKTFDPVSFLDRLAQSIDKERKEVNELVNQPVGSSLTGTGPSELDRIIFGNGERESDLLNFKRDEPEQSIQSLLGIDRDRPNEREHDTTAADRTSDQDEHAHQPSETGLKLEENDLNTIDKEVNQIDPEFDS